MIISVIGLGKLGLPIACVFASRGHKVIGIDSNDKLISGLKENKLKVLEPQVNEYLTKYRDNFKFDTSYVNQGEIIFVVVPTPSQVDHKFTSEYIEKVLSKLKKKVPVVIVSTVMPGEMDRLQRKFPQIDLVYNPLFIALGSVVYNFTHPDIVLIGTYNLETAFLLKSFYKKIVANKPKIIHLTPLEAEITKIGLNCFITAKITFANQIGNLCHRLGVSGRLVCHTIGLDSRIGNKYFKPGLGYGGTCFPRDNRALAVTFKGCGLSSILLDTVDNLNNFQVDEMIKRIVELNPKSVGFESLSYKEGCEIVECSQLLEIFNRLKRRGINVKIGESGEITLNHEGIR